MAKSRIKYVIEKYFGYWLYKTKYLPIGADIKIDIEERLGYKNVKNIFDVGANIGQTYKKFRNDFPLAAIYSFEPISQPFESLKKAMDNDAKALAENMALGETGGTQKVKLFTDLSVLNSLREDLMNSEEGAAEEIISIDTLDNYCRQKNVGKIDILKIDTEGFELNVLKGGIGLILNRNISFILCEVGFNTANTRNTGFNELSVFLAEKGYLFFGLYDMSDDNWRSGLNFGNALFVNTNLLNG